MSIGRNMALIVTPQYTDGAKPVYIDKIGAATRDTAYEFQTYTHGAALPDGESPEHGSRYGGAPTVRSIVDEDTGTCKPSMAAFDDTGDDVVVAAAVYSDGGGG